MTVSVARATVPTILVSLLEVTRSSAIFRLIPLLKIKHVLFFGLFHDCVRQTEKFDVVATDVNLLQLVKFLSVVVVVDNVCQGEIHPRITVVQLSEDCFTIFQLYENLLVFDAR